MLTGARVSQERALQRAHHITSQPRAGTWLSWNIRIITWKQMCTCSPGMRYASSEIYRTEFSGVLNPAAPEPVKQCIIVDLLSQLSLASAWSVYGAVSLPNHRTSQMLWSRRPTNLLRMRPLSSGRLQDLAVCSMTFLDQVCCMARHAVMGCPLCRITHSQPDIHQTTPCTGGPCGHHLIGRGLPVHQSCYPGV